MPLPARPTTRLLGLALTAALVLSGCSGEADPPAAEESSAAAESGSPSASETAEPYLEVPDGVELTAQGSTLSVGDTATVAYELPKQQVGALEVQVTSLERADFSLFEGWELTKDTRATAPYFVRATVTNVGETNLGGRPVPLYIVDGDNRLIESSIFTGTFKPCDGASFPKKFRSGASLKACMVYLAPDKGDLTAVSFRPTQEFNPVTWEGELKPAKGTGKGAKGKKQRGGQGNGNG